VGERIGRSSPIDSVAICWWSFMVMGWGDMDGGMMMHRIVLSITHKVDQSSALFFHDILSISYHQ
jgi:hypothetical protein